MKVSINWLKRHVDLKEVSIEKLADLLTFAGVECEGIERLASGTNLVIGEILSCVEHPDSDHLHVLQVDEGPVHGIHQIVCGAPNARKGLKVIVAREGAVLPQVTIVKSKIRGVESDGMCCSLLELGVDKKMLREEQTAGIEELPADAPVGEENVLGYLGLDDVILDLALLANRSDLYALENVAREVATLLDQKENLDVLDVLEPFATSGEEFPVGSATSGCTRFGAYLVRNVKIKSSPRWLVRVLEAEGIRSINNVVDIGNFVMLLTGQPLNMYDYDKLPEKRLEVRDDLEGDWLAMDEKTYRLEKGDLSVASGGRTMCLAGIMTSAEAAVDEKSENIVIEAAYFNGASIRHTSNRLGLSSDSSMRFVKGTNIEGIDRALDMAVRLLLDLAEAKSVSPKSEFRSVPSSKKTIETTVAYINARLGAEFSEEEIISTLRRDHLEVEKKGDKIVASIPSYRVDIGGEADLSEEVIRLNGFGRVGSSLPDVEGAKGGLTDAQKKTLAIRRILRAQGLNEVLTYTLVNEVNSGAYLQLAKGEPYALLNPLTEDRRFVRRGLLPSLFEAAAYNLSRQARDFALFEVSDVDGKQMKGLRLGLVLVGEKEERGSLRKRPYDFYDAKGILVAILHLLGIQESRYEFKRLSAAGEEWHPGRSAVVSIGRDNVAVLGELHPLALERYSLGKNAVAMEIDLGVLEGIKVGDVKAKIPSKFPIVSRDLAFIINKKADFASLRREIKRSDKLIKEVEIFDVYEGANIAAGKKSMAVTLSFAAEDRTLTDAEINPIMEKIIGMLRMRFLAEVRQG